MVIAYLLSLLAVGLAVTAGGLICRRLAYSNESWRKLTHCTHGVYIGVLPFFTDIRYVIITEVVFLLAMAVVRYMHVHYDRQFAFVHYLGGMYRVGRESYGEFLFPLGIIGAALLADSLWIYLAGALVLGVADAVAAVVGKKFGKHPYKVFGQNKSFQGSLAFFAVSLMVLSFVIGMGSFEASTSMFMAAVVLSIALTAVENLGVYGWDNFLLPVVTVVVLNALA